MPGRRAFEVPIILRRDPPCHTFSESHCAFVGGKVWISYNSPECLRERHGIPQELLQNIAVVETLAAKAAE